MAKKRRRKASIKGRGAEILFGEKSPEDFTVIGEIEAARVIEEEGREEIAEPTKGPPSAPPPEIPPPRPTKVAPPAPPPPEEKVEAPTPPPPAVEEPPAAAPPAPAAPPPTVERPPEEVAPPPAVVTPPPEEAPPAPELPPPEPPPVEEPIPVPQLRLGGILTQAPVPTGPAFGPLVPTVPSVPTTAPPPAVEERELTEEEKRQIQERIGQKRFEDLAKEIDKLYERAVVGLGASQRATDEAFQRLQKARDTLLMRPWDFDTAEYNAGMARAILDRAENVRRWGTKHGFSLLLYELGIFLLLLGALIFDARLARFVAFQAGLDAVDSMTKLFLPWQTLIWGGIGGVVGALYSLYWHVSIKQDFDPQFNLSYIVKPLMGIIMGSIVFLIIATGFLTLGQAEQLQAVSQGQATAATNFAINQFPALLATLAGFRHEFAFELLDSIMKIILRQPEKE
ncbi:MAG: hypothetical protein ACE5NP_09580 [Anaerolineae bacterium]